MAFTGSGSGKEEERNYAGGWEAFALESIFFMSILISGISGMDGCRRSLEPVEKKEPGYLPVNSWQVSAFCLERAF